ncbi:hypothetical protein B0F87_11350 [Methylobacter tundripaludum]|uniref:Uncharacterized protein n=1 Tax=Methylobacter tundripaludum TaxID=173365 RepID=A0A2S6H8X1_9GAMM|nr:hypothetical protein B0F87_11350 [Methylobacter tundripaludum]
MTLFAGKYGMLFDSFSLEQKRGIAAQHKDKSQLRKSSTGELINLGRGA